MRLLYLRGGFNMHLQVEIFDELLSILTVKL